MTKPDEVWVCPACGRYWEGHQYDGGDTSCIIYAIKVEKYRIVVGRGRVIEVKERYHGDADRPVEE